MQQYEFYDVGEFEQFTSEGRTPLATAKRHPVFADMRHEVGEENVGQRNYEEITSKNAVFNERDDELAYMSSDRYDLIQHHDVLQAIKTAVDETTGGIDYGMIRDYGARMDGILVFSNQDEAKIDMRELLGDDYIPPEGRPNTDPTAEDSRWRDTVGLGMRFRNSFDGGTKVAGSTMGYRYICQNWLVWDEAEIGSVERQHTRSVDESDGLEPEFFADIIQDVFEVKSDVETTFLDAEATEVPLTWVPGILERHDFGANYQKRITGRILNHEPVSDDGDETTIWRVYNATTSELDRNTAVDSSAYTYDYYQSYAWNMMNAESEEASEPEESLEDLNEVREFAVMPEA